VGYTATPVPASRVVIIEGIYALNERLKHLLDLRVSIAGRRCSTAVSGVTYVAVPV
jgi:uridine kinase